MRTGSFLFQYTDSNLNGARMAALRCFQYMVISTGKVADCITPCRAHAGGSTFGIRSYGSSSYQATGASGAYKVDSLTNKPAYSAFKSAL